MLYVNTVQAHHGGYHQDKRSGLYFFSMKPVVIGEGTQTIRVNSKRWNFDSYVTLDVSPECTDEYGMTFEQQLPWTELITAEYDGSNNAWTDFRLKVNPGTVATGISESDSDCFVILSDPEYTIKRRLRQINPEDKNSLDIKYPPNLAWASRNLIKWDAQGHPPGSWFLNTTSVLSVSYARNVKTGKVSTGARNIYNDTDPPHPESLYAGGVPDDWVDNEEHFCVSVRYGSGVRTGATSPERCYNGPENDDEARPGEPGITPTPVEKDFYDGETAPASVRSYDAWCNPIENNKASFSNVVEIDGRWEFVMRYQCSEKEYIVSHRNNPEGYIEFTWHDPTLPMGVNGTEYDAPIGFAFKATPTPIVYAPHMLSRTSTPTPVSTDKEEAPKPTATHTPTPTHTPTATPTSTPEANIVAPYVVFNDNDGLTEAQRDTIRETVANLHEEFVK